MTDHECRSCGCTLTEINTHPEDPQYCDSRECCDDAADDYKARLELKADRLPLTPACRKS